MQGVIQRMITVLYLYRATRKSDEFAGKVRGEFVALKDKVYADRNLDKIVGNAKIKTRN